jgi:hypothetical protein
LLFISGLGALKKWRLERGWDPDNPRDLRRIVAVEACEHIVVLPVNKRDLALEGELGEPELVPLKLKG